MKNLNGARYIFWFTLITAAYRDAFTHDSNLEIYAYVVTGVIVAFIAHVLFDKKAEDKA